MRYTWIIMGTRQHVSYYLSKSAILPGSNVFVVSKTVNQFQFRRFYKTALKEPLTFHEYGTFKDNQFLKSSRQFNRLNLNGIQFKSMAVLSSNASLESYRNYR